jgi:leucyl aminopeptidase
MRISILVQCVHDTRDLVNQPPNDLYPESFVDFVEHGVGGLEITMQIWDEVALEAEGFGGISAVGKGSTRPPRLVKLSYAPQGATKHIALVGKGITFDSGGLSLKSGAAMVGMKYDMAGAASVYQAIVGIARLGLNVRATSWLCLAENLPSGSATRPNDVIKIRNGKTVEVLNTDAEGRLVLADGLSAACEEFPDLIVDVATLTGAATVALGNRYAGLMGDAQLVTDIEKAANRAGELVWHMPLAQELSALLESQVADLANTKIGNRVGGMLLGGLFLKEFIGPTELNSKSRIAWAHLDIAGPAENEDAAYGYTPKGGTGAIVRTLVELAEQVSKA